jgi:hypothetical protein
MRVAATGDRYSALRVTKPDPIRDGKHINDSGRTQSSCGMGIPAGSFANHG